MNSIITIWNALTKKKESVSYDIAARLLIWADLQKSDTFFYHEGQAIDNSPSAEIEFEAHFLVSFFSLKCLAFSRSDLYHKFEFEFLRQLAIYAREREILVNAKQFASFYLERKKLYDMLYREFIKSRGKKTKFEPTAVMRNIYYSPLSNPVPQGFKDSLVEIVNEKMAKLDSESYDVIQYIIEIIDPTIPSLNPLLTESK